MKQLNYLQRIQSVKEPLTLRQLKSLTEILIWKRRDQN